MSREVQHPIVFLWCHPRSMSTAIERLMRQRGDFHCFHEPFMYDYYVHRNKSTMPHFDIDPSQPVKYPAIRNMLLDAAQHSPVFVKDMSYYVVPQLFDDGEFAQRIRHSFLIRNPIHAIVSYFKLDQNLSLDEIGLEAQWRQRQWLKTTFGIEAIVLRAEAIRKNPEQVITDYWRKLSLDIKPGAFTWDKALMPDDWRAVGEWHKNVSTSSNIRQPNEQNDLRREHEFKQLAERHPKLQAFYEHHLPYYLKLKAAAKIPCPAKSLTSG